MASIMRGLALYAVAVLAPLMSTILSTSVQHRYETPTLEIKLADLGYRSGPDCHYQGSGIPRDLSLLNDDYKKRIVFINDETLVVYQSHCSAEQSGSPGVRSMEAFFVNLQTSKLISKLTWPTIQRRWVNERWDTEARIFATSGGFIVHAGHSLIAYSDRLEKKAELSLEVGPKWAATIPPEGHSIHLQRIEDDNRADGRWLDSDTLKSLRNQEEMAGIVSASDDAVATKLAHCVQLKTIGEGPRNVYCSDASHLGLPLFLSNTEMIATYYKGFGVWSTGGKKLWEREASRGSLLGNTKRSLRGNRFAKLTRGPVVFDGLSVPEQAAAILVYDAATKEQIFHLMVEDESRTADFDLSPDGDMLGVLVGDAIRVYKLSSQ